MAQRPSSDAVAAAAIAAINGLPNMLRQALTDEAWTKIPLYLTEQNYAANWPANTVFEVQPQYSALELIRSVVVSIPAGGSAVVQLGSATVPVGAGITTIIGHEFLLRANDRRSVTCDTAGPISLWLAGLQVPSQGVIST